MKKDVFISYSKQDSWAADRVRSFLEQRGIECWIAPRDIEPGREFEVAILDAIDHTEAIVVIFSHNANDSQFVKNEVNRAFSKGKTIFTFRIEDVFPAKALEFYLARHHWTDGFPPPLEETMARLSGAIGVLLSKKWPTNERQVGETKQPLVDTNNSNLLYSTVEENLTSSQDNNFVQREVAHELSFEHSGPASFLLVTDFPELMDVPSGKEVTRFEVSFSVRRKTKTQKGKRELELAYHTHYAQPPKFIPYGQYLPVSTAKAGKWVEAKLVAVHRGVDCAWLRYHAEGDGVESEIVKIKNIRTKMRIESIPNS